MEEARVLEARDVVGQALGFQPRIDPAQLELGDHLARERPQRLGLGRGEHALALVDHAERAERMPLGRQQRGARIEADEGLAGHEGVVGEALVVVGVGHDQQLGLQDGVGAEGGVAGGLGRSDPVARLEPLPIAVHQAHQGDRSAAQLGGQLGHVVVGGLGRGVENLVAPQGLEPIRFVVRHGRLHGRWDECAVGRIHPDARTTSKRRTGTTTTRRRERRRGSSRGAPPRRAGTRVEPADASGRRRGCERERSSRVRRAPRGVPRVRPSSRPRR